MLDELAAIWLVGLLPRSRDTLLIAQWDEGFHWAMVTARMHSDVTERIRVTRRLDFTKQPRIDAT